MLASLQIPHESGRRRLAGGLLAMLIVASAANGLRPEIPSWVAGAMAWLAAIVLWPTVERGRRTQAMVLAGVGLAGVMWGIVHGGAAPPIARLIGQNQAIIALLAAVSFLRLLHPTHDGGESLPVGAGAFVRTMFGVHLFGTVINMSAIVIFGDRLAQLGAMGKAQALLLGRSFTMAAFYSPFVGGVALALVLAPGADLKRVMVTGTSLAAVGFGYLYFTGVVLQRTRVSEFRGFPVRFESLGLPGLLAICVLGLHIALPELPVLTLIVMVIPGWVALLLLGQRGLRRSRHELGQFVTVGLPGMSGELMLFLGAGVLAVGLGTVAESLGDWRPFAQYDAGNATLTLALIVAVSLLGVHPVAVVSTAGAVIAPIADDPSLLAMTFTMGWGIGCAVNPYSGINLTLGSRYGLKSWGFPRWNGRFSLVLFCAGALILHVYDGLT